MCVYVYFSLKIPNLVYTVGLLTFSSWQTALQLIPERSLSITDILSVRDITAFLCLGQTLPEMSNVLKSTGWPGLQLLVLKLAYSSWRISAIEIWTDRFSKQIHQGPEN